MSLAWHHLKWLLKFQYIWWHFKYQIVSVKSCFSVPDDSAERKFFEPIMSTPTSPYIWGRDHGDCYWQITWANGQRYHNLLGGFRSGLEIFPFHGIHLRTGICTLSSCHHGHLWIGLCQSGIGSLSSSSNGRGTKWNTVSGMRPCQDKIYWQHYAAVWILVFWHLSWCLDGNCRCPGWKITLGFWRIWKDMRGKCDQ